MYMDIRSQSKKDFLQGRVAVLRDNLVKHQYDAFISFSDDDNRYLLGVELDACILVVSAIEVVLFVPLLMEQKVKQMLTCMPSIKLLTPDKKRNIKEQLDHYLRIKNYNLCGTDLSTISVQNFRWMDQHIHASLEHKPLIQQQRIIKDPYEISCVRKACQITAKCIERLSQHLSEQLSEIECVRLLVQEFWKYSDEEEAFATIVGFGENSAFPHHKASKRPLHLHENILVDCGVRVDGYCADMTRTFFFGKETKKFIEIYNLVLEASHMASELVKEGASTSKIDQVARQYIKKAGYGNFFSHATGHGVGLAIHEEPRISTDSQEMLKENMIITIEPGIYIPEAFGVRIENTLLVKKDGYEILTQKKET